jgi:DNA-binding IclR family transcriptional regulator
VSLSSSSLGRALLAFQPPALVEAVKSSFVPTTSQGPQDAAALEAALDLVRRLGSARAVDEWQVGVTGVAAPIRDAQGQVAGAMCITGPTSRMGPERLDALETECRAAAAEVSTLLGHRGER